MHNSFRIRKPTLIAEGGGEGLLKKAVYIEIRFKTAGVPTTFENDSVFTFYRHTLVYPVQLSGSRSKILKTGQASQPNLKILADVCMEANFSNPFFCMRSKLRCWFKDLAYSSHLGSLPIYVALGGLSEFYKTFGIVSVSPQC